MSKKIIYGLLLIALIGVFFSVQQGWFKQLYAVEVSTKRFFSNAKTIAIEQRLAQLFPPAEFEIDIALLHLLIFRQEQQAEVWITDAQHQKYHLKTIPIHMESRTTNPITAPIPVGFYGVHRFQPTPNLGMSLKVANTFYQTKVNYPDTFSISNHPPATNNLSIDLQTLEEIIQLAYALPPSATEIVIFPNDSRKDLVFKFCIRCPSWVYELYGSLGGYLELFVREQ